MEITIKLQVSAENREELIKYLTQIVVPLIRNECNSGQHLKAYWEINEI